MKLFTKALIYSFILFGSRFFSQTCPDLNFESGSLSGWAKYTGSNNNPSTMAGCCYTSGGAEAIIKTTPISDGYAGVIPNSPFGGNKVLKLGDSLSGGAWVSQLTYSFNVSAPTLQFAILPFAYLGTVIHNCSNHSYAAVRLFDNLGFLIYSNIFIPPTTGSPCGVGSAIYTNTTSTGDVAWGCWQNFNVNVSSYIGQSVSIDVTSGDCTGSIHWAYCYFDAVCTSVSPTLTPCGSPTNIKESILNKDISVWPNPASNMLHVGLNSVPQNSQFIIIDLLGNEVIKNSELKEANSISLESLSQGAYIYKVMSDGKTVKTGKFIKE